MTKPACLNRNLKRNSPQLNITESVSPFQRAIRAPKDHDH